MLKENAFKEIKLINVQSDDTLTWNTYVQSRWKQYKWMTSSLMVLVLE